MRKLDTFSYGDLPENIAEAAFPDGDGFPIMLFFHGGGLNKGNYRGGGMQEEMTAHGIGVVSAEYRLLPKHHFPDMLVDAANAVAYVQKHMTEWGGNGKLFVSGSSAGAYISMMLHFNPVYYEQAGVDGSTITGYISNSAQQLAHYQLLYDRGFDKRTETVDETAPLYYLGENTPLRPLSLIYYTNDLACRPEENRLMREAIRRFFPDADAEIHELSGGHCKPDNPQKLVDLYVDFIKRHDRIGQKLKVLSIGNSFSADAHRWLHAIAAADGIELDCTDLVIGGCSLERHAGNLTNGTRDYYLGHNGEHTDIMLTLPEGLARDQFDIVTVQQVSQLAGMPDSYQPFLDALIAAVRAAQPQAKLYFQETWAYETDSTHAGFADYGNDQRKMYDAVHRTVAEAAQSIGATVIPTGTVIQYLRENVPAFDYAHGGLSLNRDGFHLTEGYGRFAAGLTWYATLIGNDPTRNTFIPPVEGDDPAVIAEIRRAVGEVLKG